MNEAFDYVDFVQFAIPGMTSLTRRHYFTNSTQDIVSTCSYGDYKFEVIDAYLSLDIHHVFSLQRSKLVECLVARRLLSWEHLISDGTSVQRSVYMSTVLTPTTDVDYYQGADINQAMFFVLPYDTANQTSTVLRVVMDDVGALDSNHYSSRHPNWSLVRGYASDPNMQKLIDAEITHYHLQGIYI